MELREYVSVLRRRKALVAVPVFVAVVVAVALSFLGPRSYASSTTLFFSPDGSTSASTQQDQVQASYVALVKSPRVAAAVIDRLRLGRSVNQVRDSLSAETKPGTLLVVVTATGSSRRQAELVASTATDELVGLSGELEPPSAGSTATGPTLAQEATPAQPRSTFVRNLALGLAVSLFIGVLLAFVREGLDNRVTSDDQLLGDHGMRTLAQLPISRDDDDAIALLAGRRGPMDEGYRRLRLALQLTGATRPRVIVVAACSANAGATTTTTGLGLTLADAGLRAVVVCGDPARAADLGEKAPAGLTDVLGGRATLDEALQPTSHGSLRQLQPGRDPDSLDELLSSDAMTELLARLQGEADVVLVETPPLPGSVAAALLAESTGAGVVLVVRHGETRRDQVGRAVELLRQSGVPLLGAVVTRSPAEAGRAPTSAQRVRLPGPAKGPDTNSAELAAARGAPRER